MGTCVDGLAAADHGDGGDGHHDRERDEQQGAGEQHADRAAEEGADHAGAAEDEAGAPADAAGASVARPGRRVEVTPTTNRLEAMASLAFSPATYTSRGTVRMDPPPPSRPRAMPMKTDKSRRESEHD